MKKSYLTKYPPNYKSQIETQIQNELIFRSSTILASFPLEFLYNKNLPKAIKNHNSHENHK